MQRSRELYPGQARLRAGQPATCREEFRRGEASRSTTSIPIIVVIGYDTTLDLSEDVPPCATACAQGLPYVATHPDFNCPTETGFMPRTSAPSCAFIEASTGRRPDLIVGKP